MNPIKSFFRKLAACCPKAAKPFFLLALISLGLQAGFMISPTFADFYNRYPGAFLRMLLAYLTGWIPFSLAETLIMMMPLFVILIVIQIFRTAKKALRDMVRMMLSLFAVLCFFLSSFTLTFSAGYRGTSLADKLSLTEAPVSATDLDSTARLLLDKMAEILDEVDFRYDASSIMPYSLDTLNQKLQDAYAKASKVYDFLPSFRSHIKAVVLSEPMTYTHIAGVYTYFTGESNINVNFPDYTLPYTAAHELAHQRGIAREDEANFVAFLVCLQSDDPYIRYSGCMSVYEYVISALYRADKTMYNALLKETDNRLVYEIVAYNEFFEKYRENTAASISGAVNDSFLQSQGQSAGTRSYGMVVDLTVAYFKANSGK